MDPITIENISEFVLDEHRNRSGILIPCNRVEITLNVNPDVRWRQAFPLSFQTSYDGYCPPIDYEITNNILTVFLYRNYVDANALRVSYNNVINWTNTNLG